jgi:hypothetical protein
MARSFLSEGPRNMQLVELKGSLPLTLLHLASFSSGFPLLFPTHNSRNKNLTHLKRIKFKTHISRRQMRNFKDKLKTNSWM